jgi:transcriptional regulator with XRE-family HTH domain
MRRGLSQEQLAGICGLDRSYIGGVERGERNPSLMIVERIALGLGMSLAELFKGVSSGSSKSAGTKER